MTSLPSPQDLTATKRTGEGFLRLKTTLALEGGPKSSLRRDARGEDLASLKEAITTPFLEEMSEAFFRDSVIDILSFDHGE
jgi:hypothetical protein